MTITLSVRHGEVPEPIKRYFRSEVEGLAKYFDRLVEADLFLDQEGHRNIAEVRIHTSNDTHFASSEASDARTAIDATVKKLRRQLQRRKEKLTGRVLPKVERERLFGDLPSPGEPSGPDPSVAPAEWPRISSGEAIARLENTGEDVLVFVDAVDGTVKIGRRNEAGSVSVVEAEAFEVEEG